MRKDSTGIRQILGFLLYGVFAVLIAACGGDGTPNSQPDLDSTSPSSQSVSAMLTIQKSGTGFGTITSNPAGLNCGTTCTLTVALGTVITLTVAPAPNNTLADWGAGALCSRSRPTCSVTVTNNQTLRPT